MTPRVRTGPTNSLTDVGGLRVGHADRRGDGWLTGTTVVLAPPEGVVAGVDVRGGGPGTRETDLLDPRTLVDRVHAIVLTGGSAYGLSAADGVMRRLRERGVGFAVGEGPGEVVPIVPAAVVFDLGRGGVFQNHPDAAFGAAAHDAAFGDGGPDGAGRVRQGSVGAGTGCVAGGLRGGVGSASVVLGDGTTVAALAVVNALGSVVDPATGVPHAVRFGLDGEFDAYRGTHSAPVETPSPPWATTLVVVATDLTLTQAQCAKLAGIGHDGLARAINPVHTMLDGDTVFAVATGRRPAPDLDGLQRLLAVAGDCVTRAVGHAVLA